MLIVTDCELRPNIGVSTARKDIVKRLQTLPEALDISAAELCRRIKCKPNAWSGYVKEDGKRVVTRPVANRLCDEFKLSLDWIYRGDTSGLQASLIKRLNEAA